MGSAALIGMGIGAVGSIAQGISGASQVKNAQEQLDNYQRQTLTNTAENLRVSRLGADLQTQQLARQEASTTDALRSGGSRGLAMMGQVTQAQNQAQRQIGADLDAQQMQVDRLKAQGEAQRQGMMEQRQNKEVDAINQTINQGKETMWKGIGGLAQTGMSGAMLGSQGLLGGSGGTNVNNPFTNMMANQPSSLNLNE